MGNKPRIALVGNPNSGKSSLFNVLTGLNQRVGNFPGVTVDRKIGQAKLPSGKAIELLDLPGTYSLYPSSEDERIATEVLREAENPDRPDLVVVVADATNLKRSLLLASQVHDLCIPMVLVLNMEDLIQKQGIKIDLEALGKAFNTPVVSLSALRKKGISKLWKLLESAVEKQEAVKNHPFFPIPLPWQKELEEISNEHKLSSPYAAFQLLMQPGELGAKKGLKAQMEAARDKLHIEKPEELVSNELAVRYDRIDEILQAVRKAPPTKGETFTNKLDKWLLHPVLGYVIFVVILFLVFQSIFWLATYPMDWIDLGFAWLSDAAANALPQGWFTDLVAQGIIPGIGGVVIFVPQIALLFMFIAIMEDSGYMSRVVFLMDRIMRPFGFSGKSVIPLVGGMACAVPSIMMARNIPNRSERLITILVTPLMSCSARIPVYVLLIGMFVPNEQVLGIFHLQGLVMTGMYFLGFFMALAVAWVIKKVLKYKANGTFATELPIYRAPRWGNVLTQMGQKSKAFVWEAGKVILAISIVLWFMSSFAPGDRFENLSNEYIPQIEAAKVAGNEAKMAELDQKLASEKLRASYAGIFGQTLEPVIRPLGFDWKIGISLITSFAAREVFVGTMATIYSLEEGQLEGDDGPEPLREKMRAEVRPDGTKVYSTPTAIALLLFYAFAMQCMSTLAITKRETGSWKMVGVMLVYMTGLAYVSALLAFQGLSALGF